MSGCLAIADSTIIGAMTPPTSNSPFNRANLVVRHDDVIVTALAYTRDGNVEGPSLDAEAWQALLTTGQALAVPEPAALVSGAALWVLRPSLPRRARALQDLRTSGVLLHEHMLGEVDSWLVLVDESQPAASYLRDRWRAEAIDAAQAMARSAQWPRAQAEAEIAHAVARGLDPEALAFLMLTYEHCGRQTRSTGILTMARSSRGEDFARQVDERLELLRFQMAQPVIIRSSPSTAHAGPARTPSLWAQMQVVARRGIKQTLQQHPNKAAS